MNTGETAGQDETAWPTGVGQLEAKLAEEVALFTQASHLFWGLWGAVQVIR